MQKSQSHEVVDTRWVELLIDGEKIHHRTNHAAAIDNSVMYVYGGYDIELGILGDFYRIALNAQKFVWKPIQINSYWNPGPRRNHTLCIDNNMIFLLGGQINATDSTNKLHRFDLTRSAWEKPEILQIPCIDSHECLVYEGRMYIYGGYQADFATYNSEIYEYDINTKHLRYMEVLGRKPTGRCSFSLSLLNESFYIFGGSNGNNLNDMWSYNLHTKEWTQVSSHDTLWPEPRRGHSSAAYRNHIFLFGGIQTITKERNDIYAFDLIKMTWIKIQANANESYKLSEKPEKPVKTQQSAMTLQPRKFRHKTIANRCKFSLTISSFGDTAKRDFCQFAQTSLYRRRGQPQLFSAVVRSKSTFVKQSKRKSVKIEKLRMLSEFNVDVKPVERKLSPVSEAVRHSLIAMGNQHKTDHHLQTKELKVPSIRYDEKRGFLIGKKPCARDGQTAVVFRQSMVIFGGDRHMMSFNDIFLFQMDKALRRANSQRH